MIGGNRSMIVRQQAIISYTPHWIKLSRNVPARRRYLYLTTHNTHKGDIHVPVEIRICSPSKCRPQTHDIGREGTGISISVNIEIVIGYRKIRQHDINETQKKAKLGNEHLLQ